MELSFTLRTPVDGSGLGHEVPACATWVPTDVTKFLGGYSSGRVAVFDVKKGTQVLNLLAPQTLEGSGSLRSAASVTSACCHRVLQLAATGHIDRCARLVDFVSGKFVTELAGHPDVVTSVAMDPSK